MMRASIAVLSLLFLMSFVSVSAREETFLPVNTEVITAANASRLKEITSIGEGRILSISLSPKGDSVAVVTTESIDLYDLNHPQPPRTLVEDIKIQKAVFDSAWQWVAVYDGLSIRILSMTTGDQIQGFDLPYWYMTGMAVSPDGRLLAAAATTEGGIVTVWSIETGGVIYQQEHRYSVESPKFSSDSNVLTYIFHEFDMMSHNLDSMNFWRVVRLSDGEIIGGAADFPSIYYPRTLGFSSDEIYASPAPDHSVWAIEYIDNESWYLWDISGQELDLKLPSHYEFEAFRSDGEALLYNQQTQQLTLLNLQTQRMQPVLTSRNPSHVSWSATGQILAFTEDAHTLRIVNIETQQDQTIPLNNYLGSIGKMIFDKEGTDVYLSEDITNIRRFSLETGEGDTIASVPDATGQFAYDHVSSRVAVATRTGSIELWDTTTKERTAIYDSHDGAVTALAFSSDGQFLISYGKDHALRVRDVASGTSSLLAYYPEESSIGFVPDLNTTDRLVVSYNKNDLILYDLNERKEIQHINVSLGTDLLFSPQASYLSDGNNIYSSDFSQAKPERTSTTRYVSELRDFDFGQEEDVLVTSELTFTHPYWMPVINLWALETAEHIDSLELNDSTADALLIAFNGDGRFLLVAGGDGKIHIWGIPSADK